MISITPYIRQDSPPRASEELQNAIVALCKRDADLNANIPHALKQPMIHLLKIVNSFYSNKIEGNPTHPAEIIYAQEQNTTKTLSENLLEIKQHIEVQTQLAQLNINKDVVCTPNFLKEIHQSFYQGLPEQFLTVENPHTGEILKVIPGEFRQRNVKVSHHISPEYTEIESLLRWFETIFNLKTIHGTNAILAAAASHHRLMWIHPFLDGNGRVGRLFTDNYMRCAGLGGYGLWSMSRGFGRNTQAYYAALASADMPRQGSSDGRGLLSDRGLLQFTEYFIQTAVDQVNYFSELLDAKMLNTRIDYYFQMRSQQALPSQNGKTLLKLKIEAKEIYKRLLHSDSLERSQIQQMCDMSEYSLRTLISQMKQEGLIKAEPRKPLSLAISPSSIQFLFPDLLWAR